MFTSVHQERLATAEERGALQAQVLREELAAVRLQLAAECDRRAAAEQRIADATGRELRDLHVQARLCCLRRLLPCSLSASGWRLSPELLS
jgi:hypothetical protein